MMRMRPRTWLRVRLRTWLRVRLHTWLRMRLRTWLRMRRRTRLRTHHVYDLFGRRSESDAREELSSRSAPVELLVVAEGLDGDDASLAQVDGEALRPEVVHLARHLPLQHAHVVAVRGDGQAEQLLHLREHGVARSVSMAHAASVFRTASLRRVRRELAAPLCSLRLGVLTHRSIVSAHECRQ